MSWILGILGLGGVATAVANSVSSLVQSIAPFLGVVLQAAANFVVWYLKEFWKGLQVILSNLSTLTVIAALMLGTGYYTRDYNIRKCDNRIEQTKKNQIPLPTKKPIRYEWTPWPWEWF